MNQGPNAVQSGPIAVLGTSDSALREVTTLVHHYGAGVSVAARVAAQDLHDAAGGRATLAALDRVAAEGSTRVVVIVSTPPSPAVAARVLARAVATGAEVVAAFPGYMPPAHYPGVTLVNTFEDAARAAAAMSGAGTTSNHPTMRVTLPRFTREQRWIRALYAGTTLGYEALTMLAPSLKMASNLSFPGVAVLAALAPASHSLADFGDPALSRGHGHPRLDVGVRADAVRSLAHDPTARLLLLDVPLGDGAHPDPASLLAPAIREARSAAASRGGTLITVASVTGTEGDPQQQSRQIHALVSAGVEVCSSNAAAVRRVRSVALGEWP